jgi:hypothetical protein
MPRTPRIALSLLVLAASASAQEVSLDFSRDHDFSSYKSFAWSPAQQPAKNPANHIRITRAVEEGLGPKGMVKSTDGRPDVYLMYQGKVGDKVKVRGKSQGGYWEPTNLRTVVDLNKVKEGTLVLEFYDARTRDIVWRGVATSVGVREDRAEEEIKAAVKKLLEGYPPKKPEAEPEP